MKHLVGFVLLFALISIQSYAKPQYQSREQLIKGGDDLVKRALGVVDKLKADNKTKDANHVKHEADDIAAMTKEINTTDDDEKRKRLEERLYEEIKQFSAELDKFEQKRNKRQAPLPPPQQMPAMVNKEVLITRAEDSLRKAVPMLQKLKSANKIREAERIEDRAEDIAEIARKVSETDINDQERLQKLARKLSEHETKLNRDMTRFSNATLTV